ncbi:RNA polymerase sigma factor [Pontibacter harenae]|uniref:RNA polymerase sigma factor n=1 Tax=Pontibacter harenae TaxID=2894083 RepID=UPI001E5A687C|nr:RNA polymerase sigma-70 factor [Pontibacter harenae]MCC9167910.1 RNA polymerase sigma-70 factor [Pontibacter harenae]
MEVLRADTELIERIKQLDDSNAFKEIFEKYWESLYASAFKRLKSQDECSDIVQEIFADMWKRRNSLRVTGSLNSYLHTAVKYHVFKVIENRRWERDISSPENLHISVCDASLEFEELFEVLEIALDKLPERQQLIFRMSRFEGLKSHEIADALNISQQTVHNNLHKSLTVLRAELKDYAPSLLFLTLLN